MLPTLEWSADILTGPGLLAMYSLMMVGNGDGTTGGIMAAAGGLLGVMFVFASNHVLPQSFVRWPHKWERPLTEVAYLLNDLARVCFNCAQIFMQAARVDSDVGAGLCVVPLYALLCMQGTSSHHYRRESQALTSVVAACTLLAVGIYSATGANVYTHPLIAEREPGEVVAWWWYLLAVTDTAIAVVNPGRPATSVGSAVLRASALAITAALPRMLFALLGPQPPWIFVLHGALLVQSSMTHAGQARHDKVTPTTDAIQGRMSQQALQRLAYQATRSSQRTLMLVMAPTIAVGFVFQWEFPEQASCVSAGIASLGVGLWLLQWFDGNGGI